MNVPPRRILPLAGLCWILLSTNSCGGNQIELYVDGVQESPTDSLPYRIHLFVDGSSKIFDSAGTVLESPNYTRDDGTPHPNPWCAEADSDWIRYRLTLNTQSFGTLWIYVWEGQSLFGCGARPPHTQFQVGRSVSGGGTGNYGENEVSIYTNAEDVIDPPEKPIGAGPGSGAVVWYYCDERERSVCGEYPIIPDYNESLIDSCTKGGGTSAQGSCPLDFVEGQCVKSYVFGYKVCSYHRGTYALPVFKNFCKADGGTFIAVGKGEAPQNCQE